MDKAAYHLFSYSESGSNGTHYYIDVHLWPDGRISDGGSYTVDEYVKKIDRLSSGGSYGPFLSQQDEGWLRFEQVVAGLRRIAGE